jgi:hypothetical protein
VYAPGKVVDMGCVPGSAAFAIGADALAAVAVAAAVRGDVPPAAQARAEAGGRGVTLGNAEMVAHGRALLAGSP